MSFVDILGGVNCGLVFFFGAALSVTIAGGCNSRREWALLFALCPVFLAFQTIFWLVWGLDATKQVYPLLVHLPLLLILVFGLKKPVDISLVSVCAAYLCCQLPRCAGVVTVAATGSALAGQLVYSAAIVPIFLFLLRYFVPSAQDAMTESRKALLLFSGLPVIYYVYDYTVAARINLPYADILSPNAIFSAGGVVAETLPTVVGLLYMAYTTAYRQQLQRQTQTELLNSLMSETGGGGDGLPAPGGRPVHHLPPRYAPPSGRYRRLSGCRQAGAGEGVYPERTERYQVCHASTLLRK